MSLNSLTVAFPFRPTDGYETDLQSKMHLQLIVVCETNANLGGWAHE